MSIKNPKQLLKTIWERNFETIYVHKSGKWTVDTPIDNITCTLKVTDLEGDSKQVAMWELFKLNKWYMYETDEETRKEIDKENAFNKELHEHNEHSHQIFCKEMGEEYIPTPFVDFQDIFESFNDLFTDELFETDHSDEVDNYLSKISERENIRLDYSYENDGEYDMKLFGGHFFVHYFDNNHQEYEERIQLKESDPLANEIYNHLKPISDIYMNMANRNLNKKLKKWLYEDFKIKF